MVSVLIAGSRSVGHAVLEVAAILFIRNQGATERSRLRDGAHHAKAGMTKKELADLHLSIAPETKEKMAASVASQVWRVMNEIKVHDLVVTYSPDSRT